MGFAYVAVALLIILGIGVIVGYIVDIWVANKSSYGYKLAVKIFDTTMTFLFVLLGLDILIGLILSAAWSISKGG